MKKTLIALATLAAAGTAFAQSTVTISGGISTGIMNTGADGAKAAVANLGNGANAINISSTEDLGGGLRGGFTGQIRYNASSGDRNSSGTGNALFHAANAFVSGGFGTIRVGKIAEASNCGMDPWACGGGAGVIGGVTGGTAGTIGAGTQASSVSFTTPTFNGLSASVQTTVSSRANERQVLNLSFVQGPLTVQYLTTKNSVNAIGDGTTLTTALLASDKIILDANGKGTHMGAMYNFGVATVGVFNAKTDKGTSINGSGTFAATNLDRDVTGLTATVPMGAYSLLAAYAKDKKQTADKDTKIAFGVNYALSKRTTIGADMFKDELLKTSAGVAAGTGYVVRVAHSF